MIREVFRKYSRKIETVAIRFVITVGKSTPCDLDYQVRMDYFTLSSHYKISIFLSLISEMRGRGARSTYFLAGHVIK